MTHSHEAVGLITTKVKDNLQISKPMSQSVSVLDVAKELHRRVEKELGSNLPRMVGVKAVNLFRNNFRLGGFVNNGLHPWKKSQREQGAGTTAQYPTLTSGRNLLMNSIEAIPSRGAVTIRSTVPYAGIHNEGGVINTHPKVTPKMRRMAWAKVYQLSGAKKGEHLPKILPEEAQKWKALALTKKSQLNIRVQMPQRQFVGESKELDDIVKQESEKAIKRICDGIPNLSSH